MLGAAVHIALHAPDAAAPSGEGFIGLHESLLGRGRIGGEGGVLK